MALFDRYSIIRHHRLETNAVEVVTIPFTTRTQLQLRMLPSFLFSRCFRMSITWILQCPVTLEIRQEVNVMITKLSIQ